MNDKIFARNLPAERYARKVAGNPVTTRLESGVGNCYPGLEFDHRNLDRRFFPGLVFNFVDSDGEATRARAGARLMNGADLPSQLSDPALSLPAGHPYASISTVLRTSLSAANERLREGDWYVSHVRQGKMDIALFTAAKSGARSYLDGTIVWRLVRSLSPEPCEITLEKRMPNSPAGAAMKGRSAKSNGLVRLQGWRRDFINPSSGVFDSAYAPGELSQSLCSPWQHDFRDCACNYWASNHPDIVLAEDPVGAPVLPTGIAGDPTKATRYVDWLRRDRSEAGLAQTPGTVIGVRPFQVDHYEINEMWQKLAFVLRGKEIGDTYSPPQIEDVKPYASADELALALVNAAEIEHVLAIEYLYARYTIKTAAELSPQDTPLRDVVEFVRHELLIIAVSEMRHMRWANQLLWELVKTGRLSQAPPLPALQVAENIPRGGAMPPRSRKLQPFTDEALAGYIEGEAPSGALDGLYARSVATLMSGYPNGMKEIASQIVADGVGHFSRFREMQVLLSPFSKRLQAGGLPVYLRPVVPADAGSANAERSLALYKSLIEELARAYASGDAEDAGHVIAARQHMMELDTLAEDMARGGAGIPFF